MSTTASTRRSTSWTACCCLRTAKPTRSRRPRAPSAWRHAVCGTRSPTRARRLRVCSACGVPARPAFDSWRTSPRPCHPVAHRILTWSRRSTAGTPANRFRNRSRRLGTWAANGCGLGRLSAHIQHRQRTTERAHNTRLTQTEGSDLPRGGPRLARRGTWSAASETPSDTPSRCQSAPTPKARSTSCQASAGLNHQQAEILQRPNIRRTTRSVPLTRPWSPGTCPAASLAAEGRDSLLGAAGRRVMRLSASGPPTSNLSGDMAV